MNISKEDAEQSLTLIQKTTKQTVKSLVASYDSSILIVWGTVWLIAFVGTHFFLKWVWLIWISLCFAGSFATFLVFYWKYRTGNPIKNPEAENIGKKLFWFWALLFIYIGIWINIFSPISGLRINAFICTVIMFAWIISGIWSNSNHLIWLGLAVTAVTLIGFYIIPNSYYCLWMASAGSMPIIGTGLYMSYRWR